MNFADFFTAPVLSMSSLVLGVLVIYIAKTTGGRCDTHLSIFLIGLFALNLMHQLNIHLFIQPRFLNCHLLFPEHHFLNYYILFMEVVWFGFVAMLCETFLHNQYR